MQRDCGCKGIRTCLVCEKEDNETNRDSGNWKTCILSYCGKCEAAVRDGSSSTHVHLKTQSEQQSFPGIFIVEDFVSPEEERHLCDVIYTTPFVKSQSGRHKQDYGPKVNFKKKKVKTEVFTGLPDFSKFVFERMKTVSVLNDFEPVELCNLEYVPERGSAIDPHFDDFWLWGDRLVTLNLLSDTVLSFTNDNKPDVEVQVPLLRRSLIVVFGPARTEWKHAIHRHDIKERRLAMTFRELSDEFRKDGKLENVGRQLVDVALTFSGSAVGGSAVTEL